MPREVITVAVGQAGNQIGCRFWQTMCEESEVDASGKPKDTFNDIVADKIDVFFHNLNGRYVPRALMVDLEPGTVDIVKASPYGGIFKEDNYIAGNNGAGSNWAKGHYTEGAELIDSILNTIRKERERCEGVATFNICHSLGGGTGAGLGTLLLLKVRDAYPNSATSGITLYSVLPSPRISDVVVEPYNSVLSIHQLLDNQEADVMCLDNEALYAISKNKLNLKQPNFADLNYLITHVMSGNTSSIRFPGKLNCAGKKMGVNLIPFPRMKFFCCSSAPIQSASSKNYIKTNCSELTKQVWDGNFWFGSVDPNEGKYLASCLIYRGNFATLEVDQEAVNIQQTQAEKFVEWIPSNIKTGIVLYPAKQYPLSVTMVSNTTAIRPKFEGLNQQFKDLYTRKAFLHWYKGEGMDEMEFQEADKNVYDLITEYEDKENASLQGDEDEGDDDI